MAQAQLYIDSGQYERAIALLQNWRGRTEWASYARFNLGVALVRSGDVDAAKGILDELETAQKATSTYARPGEPLDMAEYGLEDTETDLIALARRVNDAMPVHMSRLVERALAEKAREVAGSRVAILGVSYLEDSDDTRNTPALPLIKALKAKEADLIAHDPYVRKFPELTIPLTDSLEQVLKGADCAAIVTKHKLYYDIDLKWARKLMRTPVIVDGRNVLAADKVRAAGFLYRGIGKG